MRDRSTASSTWETEIAFILDNLACVASCDSKDSAKNPLMAIMGRTREDDGDYCRVTESDLEVLSSTSADALTLHKDLEREFPDETTHFHAEYLLRTPRYDSDGFQASLNEIGDDGIPPPSPPAPSPPRFQTLDRLTGKLASIRAKMDCVRMVRRSMDSAEGWPVALSPIKELRSGQLKRFESLQIGSELTIPLNPRLGSGNTGGLGKGGTPDFCLSIFDELERERTYRRSPAHLRSIRKTHGEYLSQSYGGCIDNSDKNGIFPASEVPQWNEGNEWKAMAALLEPFSKSEDVIGSWVEAGVKLVHSKSNGFTELGVFPVTLRNEMTESTNNPTTQRVETEVRKALKKGFGAIAARS